MGSDQWSPLPAEIQQDIFEHLSLISPAALAKACLLSRRHNVLLNPLLYKYICIRSRPSLEILAATLIERPDLCNLVHSFFFQGPQGRRITGREALQSIQDNSPDDGDDGDDDDAESAFEHHYQSGGHSKSSQEDEMRKVGLEPGIEGEGQEATWDEHESLMYLCTLVLKLCSSNLRAIGFVDCVPWFLAPTEGGALNFPLPQCKDFTGVTVGLFGLLPHLQRSKQAVEAPTALSRIHLIGGDFGSFALQRVLLASPSATTLTHLHITAPTLYRPEHHSHLVSHIAALLINIPNLRRLSVGFLSWSAAPPPKRRTHHRGISEDAEALQEEMSGAGTGDDSFERNQFRQRQSAPKSTPSVEDDRLAQCRQAYIRALPEAIVQSRRKDVTVAIVKLPFVEGSPTGFAGWILSHHYPGNRDRISNLANKDALKYWLKRDTTELSDNVSKDGSPKGDIWQIESSLEWKYDGTRVIRIEKENDTDNHW